MMNIARNPPQPTRHIPKINHFSKLAVSIDLGFRAKPKKAAGIRPQFWGNLNISNLEFFRKFSINYLMDWTKKVQKTVVDSLSGGDDSFDVASTDAKVQPQHLVVMVNGLNGSAADWKYTAEQFVRRFPSEVLVHCSKVNKSRLTFDGVDRMGERLAEEVIEVVQRWPGLHKISFVAHSLGGLAARYAVGILYSDRSKSLMQFKSCTSKEANGQHLEQYYEATIAGLEPVNFITFATPHLGSIGHEQVPFLCGLPFLENSASQNAYWFAGRSGKHLFLTDKDSGKPLLLRMANDSDNIKFISALHSFKCRVAYANADCDLIVGWRTSSIRRKQELPQSNLFMKHEKYPHIIHVERESSEDFIPSSVVATEEFDLEEEMIKGLNQVPWVRVDVSFCKSTQRYIAHNTIQVKSYWLNSDGADVIEHMIDNFVI